MYKEVIQITVRWDKTMPRNHDDGSLRETVSPSDSARCRTAVGSAERLPCHMEWRQYYPGAIGKIVELHATYYHDHWGFDISFETQVARELGEFLSRFDARTDGFWTAFLQGRFAGSVAIDGQLGSSAGARLRWLIVDPEFQAHGVGSSLVNRAVEFCREAGHTQVFLWTFKGLDCARRLYEREGFALTEEHEVDQWGQNIREQKFELAIDASRTP
jgi:GNAT superfamily N-acetyltransferase